MNSPTAPIQGWDPEILKEIDLYLEEIYPESKKAGIEMADLDLRKSQVRGLETLITSTHRFSEILNYIKNQAGKDKKNKWSRLAPLLLKQLDLLENKVKEISKDEAAITLEIKLKLARGWARQVVSHYLYEGLPKEGKEGK